ncbi:MAG: endonuclease/exonuclease/phosphatase family protein [Methyloligellaceae bacterium]
MATELFKNEEWATVTELLDSNEKYFGFPERRPDSVILSSFNVRIFGEKANRSLGAFQLMAEYCSRCDLIAIQEVQDNLEALKFLKGLLGDEYGLVTTDAAGGVPGRGGSFERLAFLFRWQRVERTDVASDIAYERSFVANTLYENRDEIVAALDQRRRDLAAWTRRKNAARAAGGKGPNKPDFILPTFLTFIRSPQLIGFRILGFDDAAPYECICVNAHLLYGNKEKSKQERKNEFEALTRWLINRAKQRDRIFHQNIILFGDLNLEFSDLEEREKINEQIKSWNKKDLRSKKAAKVNFPFLDTHPRFGQIRTNARSDQTYDQIAFFAHDKRLPPASANADAGTVVGGYDYGFFNFVDLFVKAFFGRDKKLNDLPKRTGNGLIKRIKKDVSDHMPIWIRLPIPHMGQAEFRWR